MQSLSHYYGRRFVRKRTRVDAIFRAPLALFVDMLPDRGILTVGYSNESTYYHGSRDLRWPRMGCRLEALPAQESADSFISRLREMAAADRLLVVSRPLTTERPARCYVTLAISATTCVKRLLPRSRTPAKLWLGPMLAGASSPDTAAWLESFKCHLSLAR